MSTKKWSSTIVLAFLLGGLMGFAVPVQAQMTKTFNFDSRDLQFSREQGFDRVRLKNVTGSTGEIGRPELPMCWLTLIVPPKTRVARVEITSLSLDSLPGEYLVFPAQQPREFGKPPPPFAPPDSILYRSSLPYPAASGLYLGHGYEKEAHLVKLGIHPLRWIPSSKKLVLAKSLKVTLTLEPSNEGPLEVLRRSSLSQSDFEQYLTRVVDNPEDISKYLTRPPNLGQGSPKGKKTPMGKLVITSLPSLEGSMVDYVVITNQACSTAYQPLVDWKTQKGIPAVIRTTEWIKDRYPGCDLQEKIRNFIKDAYVYWSTNWVLIGGSNDVVPGRIVYGFSTNPYYHNVLTDLYYAGLEGNWNANKNNLFAENYRFDYLYPDSADLYPDVWVGRFPISEPEAIPPVITKVKKYEEAQYQQPYPFRKTLLLCGDDFFVTESEFNVIGGFRGIPSDWRTSPQLWKLYASGYGDQPFSVATFLENLAITYGLISHHDHCDPYQIGCGTQAKPPAPPGGYASRSQIENVVYQDDIGCSVFFSSGCHPADFSFDCIGSRFLRIPDGGGVSFIGYTTTGVFGYREVEKSNRHFHYGLFTDDPAGSQIYRLGMLTEYVRPNVFIEENTQYDYGHRFYGLVLFGDPEMPIWTNDPGQLTLEYQDPISMGQQNYTVIVKDGLTLVQDALVCLEKRNPATGEIEAYDSKLSDEYGQVTFYGFDPQTPGTFKITVTGRRPTADLHSPKGHNYLPKVVTPTVSPSTPPFVALTPHGRSYSDPQGNNDGIPNPGEQGILLTLNLTNTGGTTAQNVNIELSHVGWYISFTQNTATYPDIPPGETRSNQTPLIFNISSNVPSSVYDGWIDATIRDGSNNTWQHRFPITVLGDSLILVGHGYLRTSITGDLGSHPVDSLRLANIGSGVAHGVRAVLSFVGEGAYVPPGSNTAYFEDIPPGGSRMSPDVPVYKLYTYPPNGYFLLTISDEYGREWTKSFFFADGNFLPPTALSAKGDRTSIELSWDHNNPLIPMAGYHIYRSEFPGGSYTRLDSLNWGTAIYRDVGLTPNSTYYYRVSAVDTSVNESGLSDEKVAYTTHEFQSGWPQKVWGNGFVGFSAPAVGDIVQDVFLQREVVVAGNDSVYAFGSSGQRLSGWPIYVGGDIKGSVALGDLDPSHPGLEVVAATKTKVYAWHGDGSNIPGWPVEVIQGDWIGTCTPAIVDIDRDGILEVLCGAMVPGTIPQCRVYAWNPDGTLVTGWPTSPVEGEIRAGLAIGDINSDGYSEVFVSATRYDNGSQKWHIWVYGWNSGGSSLVGWPQHVEGNAESFASPSLGDVDGDSQLEVIAHYWDLDPFPGRKIYAWNGDGSLLWESDYTLLGSPWASPALSDVDRDGLPEVSLGLFADGGQPGVVKLFDHDGRLIGEQNFPSIIYGSPTIYDVNEDGYPDLITQERFGRLHGLNRDAYYLNEILSWPQPFQGECTSTPTLADLNNDGKLDVLTTTYDGFLYVWQVPVTYDPTKMEWATFAHDMMRTGRYSQPVSKTITTNTTWRGNIEMTGDVTVPPGVTLTIEPGTVIKVRKVPELMFKVIVQGTLNAVGTALDSIYFTSGAVSPASNDWYGIDVMGGGSANLQYCAIRYGYNNIAAESGSNNLTVSHCRITNGAAAGILLRKPASGFSQTVSDCDISDNALYGINIWGPWGTSVSATITSNTIAHNTKYGVYAHYNINSGGIGSLQIKSNTISFPVGLPNPSLYGIACDTVTNVGTVEANYIEGYGQGGIRMYRSSPKCTCNVVSNCATNGLYFFNGTSIVTHNTVSGVSTGAYVTSTSTTLKPNLGNVGNAAQYDNGENNIDGTQYDGYNATAGQVKAENNYWGTNRTFSGNWDYNPYLPGPPASCGGGGGPQMGELLEQQLPRIFALAQSRPNPATGDLVIHYQMPKACDVSVKVYNVSGQLVKTLVKGPQKAGYYAVSWNGRDEIGHAVRSGVYFYKMEAGEFQAIRKLVIVR